MHHVIRTFLRGLLVFAPLVATVGIVTFLFTRVDGWLGLPVPGLGIVATLAAIFLTGVLASNIVTRRLFELLEWIFQRLPLVKLVYGALRDLTGAIVGERRSFERPVVVTLADGSGKLLGFATRDGIDEIGLGDHVAVYVPQSYALAGHVLLFPRERVQALAAGSADTMTFIVSGGVTGLGRKA